MPSQPAAKAPAARTRGAKRAGPGEHLFDLATVNHMLGGPDYSSANGSVVEGERMIVALMRMPAGTGAEPHSHPIEQWIYVLEGTFKATVGGKDIEGFPGDSLHHELEQNHVPVAVDHARAGRVLERPGIDLIEVLVATARRGVNIRARLEPAAVGQDLLDCDLRLLR